MYKNDDILKNLMSLFSNPMFMAGFSDFVKRAQMEGLESTRQAWELSEHGKSQPFIGDIYERLSDWYSLLGFVPSAKYNQLSEENTRLKDENEFLKTMIKDFQLNLLKEGGEQAQQVWRDMLDNQMKVNTELANTFFEALNQLKPKP